jgi:hypothetical protein
MGGEGASRKVATEFFRYFIGRVTLAKVCSPSSLPVSQPRHVSSYSPYSSSDRRLERADS